MSIIKKMVIYFLKTIGYIICFCFSIYSVGFFVAPVCYSDNKIVELPVIFGLGIFLFFMTMAWLKELKIKLDEFLFVIFLWCLAAVSFLVFLPTQVICIVAGLIFVLSIIVTLLKDTIKQISLKKISINWPFLIVIPVIIFLSIIAYLNLNLYWSFLTIILLVFILPIMIRQKSI